MISSVFSNLRVGAVAAVALTAVVATRSAPVHACGGLFCSSANPVNQAAEQILFVDNGDGTVTAVIQIMYEGPAHKFAWVLPVAGTPEVGVSSNLAFDQLKAGTNPTYQLNNVTEGSCSFGVSGAAKSGAGGGSALPTPMEPSVMEIAGGSVGPYDYKVISVAEGLDSPETAAIDWLTENGFDVGELGPEVLRPYLLEGLNLIAFKLQSGADTGAIRPVMLTYTGGPSIPIRPTAVAANDDMGVLVWTLSDARAVPANYKALELNEALIDWFNPNNNYNEVVTRAADEAMGQGFVTEFAGKMETLFNSGLGLDPDWREQQWQEFTAAEHTDPLEMLEASMQWTNLDGYDDARRRAVTLPETISYKDFVRCTPCYIHDPAVVFDTQRFTRELYELVIKPLLDTAELFESRPYLTRLYTTMSADEMTTDPRFDFNSDLPDVSNRHVATRYARCDNRDMWRAELPGAGTVQGNQAGVWPVPLDSQPAAMKILEYGTKGMGKVIEDRTEQIIAMNKALAAPAGSEDAGRPTADAGDQPPSNEDQTSSGCTVASSGSGGSLAWLMLACAALLRRRTRA